MRVGSLNPHKTKAGFAGKKFVDSKKSKGWDERMEHVETTT